MGLGHGNSLAEADDAAEHCSFSVDLEYCQTNEHHSVDPQLVDHIEVVHDSLDQIHVSLARQNAHHAIFHCAEALVEVEVLRSSLKVFFPDKTWGSHGHWQSADGA